MYHGKGGWRTAPVFAMRAVNILIAVQTEHAERYRQNLSAVVDFHVELATTINDALNILADRDRPTEIFVVDNGLVDTYELVGELRQTYPRLLIIVVDEEADFGLPGKADDISTAPFTNNDLVKRINNLISERHTETLRSDSMPAVRGFAKTLNIATGLGGKQQAAVDACIDMGYEYVAYYHFDSDEPPALALKAQAGPKPIRAVAPKKAVTDDLMTWVAKTKQSRIASYGDELNHPLVAKGRLGTVACVPVAFDNNLYGVMVACNDRPDTITQENVLMMELICAQLAAATLKELSG